MQNRNIAFLGKSGAGVTSVAANVAAALAESGRRVALIGCGSRADATLSLLGGREVQTVYNALHGSAAPRPETLAFSGFKGVCCLEIGAPSAGGCTGQIFRESFDLIQRLRLLEAPRPEFVLFDLPALLPCDGLSSVLLSGRVHHAVVVTQADFASLRTVNELLRALASFGGDGPPRLAGLVGNNLTGPFAEGLIDDFAFWTGVEVLARIPRSAVATQSDLLGETVIENSPLALHAYAYRKLASRLARTLESLQGGRRPRPLNAGALRNWATRWAERIYEIDGGFIREGEAI